MSGWLYRPGRTSCAVCPIGDLARRLLFRTAGPAGIAHAVCAARQYLGAEPFLLYLGDNLTDEDLRPALERFQSEAPDALISVARAQSQRLRSGRGRRGPIGTGGGEAAVPRSNLAIAGLYVFTDSVHDAIAKLQPSNRGDYEITDAIATLLNEGRRVLVHTMTGWWQDTGSADGMLNANNRLLDQLVPGIDPSAALNDVHIEGRVWIGPGAVLERVRLRGPLIIAGNSHLTDTYVGPYTSVGDGAILDHASIENSIMLPGCRLEQPPFHLEDCLLGSGTVVAARDGRSASLQVGDDTQLFIPPPQR